MLYKTVLNLLRQSLGQNNSMYGHAELNGTHYISRQKLTWYTILYFIFENVDLLEGGSICNSKQCL